MCKINKYNVKNSLLMHFRSPGTLLESVLCPKIVNNLHYLLNITKPAKKLSCRQIHVSSPGNKHQMALKVQFYLPIDDPSIALLSDDIYSK